MWSCEKKNFTTFKCFLPVCMKASGKNYYPFLDLYHEENSGNVGEKRGGVKPKFKYA